jgi:UrcA family protein
MKYMIQAKHAIPLSFAVIGMFFDAGIAIAQDATEIIVIRAPYERVEIKSSTTALPSQKTEIIELKRVLNIRDLDLTKYADVIELNSRIENVAKESCKKLSDMFPLNRSNSSEMRRCRTDAIASTKEQTEPAIAAAK